MNLVAYEIQLSGCKHTRYIQFDLDDGKPLCYRSRMSHNAFFHGFKTQRNRNSRYLYTYKHLEEHRWTMESWKRTMSQHPEIKDIYGSVPVVTVKNLWEFYELIGWDYRKKKWST